MRTPAIRALTSLSVAVVLTWAGVSYATASPVLSAVRLPVVPIIEVGDATSSAIAIPTVGSSSVAPVSPTAVDTVVPTAVSAQPAPATTPPGGSTPVSSAPLTSSSTAPVSTSAKASTPSTTAATASSTSVVRTTASTTSSSNPGTPSLRFGLGTPGGLYDASELGPIEAAVGATPSIILAYSDFTQAAPIDGLDAVSSRGQTPMLTWEPWQAGSADQPAYSLSRIIAGDYDTYIKSWATSLKTWGKPVMLRFAHEMNGNWYPWSEQTNGNQPGQYVAAWRHVHDLFTATGERNVSWVWSPNVVYPGSTSPAELYPGAGYVDVLAIDGYNWGTTRSDSQWTDPADLFGPTIAALKSIAPTLPIIIGETSSAEAGGSKADWISSLVGYLQTQPSVTAFVWFDFDKEADWRINSSDASVAAFKAALASRR